VSVTRTDSKQRFSDRVENYVRYRPGYPEAVVDILQDETGLKPGSVIADIGSGTGISAQLFLRRGLTVFGVEPNDPMRRAAERLLAAQRGFRSVSGSAEATGLPDRSVDYVVVAQAFHWFDRPQAAREFARILRPDGWVVLLWNTRRTDGSPFLRAYEALLQEYGTDYREAGHRSIDLVALGELFAGGAYRRRAVDNQQRFDLEGLKGRLLSSSYTPTVGDPAHQPMLAALERIFADHQERGQVRFDYDTELYFGQVG
jgi:SAM-dependent methyltransferase